MKKIMIGLILGLTSGYGFAEQVSCNKIGDQTYCNDSHGNSSTSNQIGNYRYTNFSNGDTATTNRIGNTTYTDYQENPLASTRRQNNAPKYYTPLPDSVALDTATPMAGLVQAIRAKRERARLAQQAEIDQQNQAIAARLQAEQMARQQAYQEAENKRKQEAHELDMKLKRAQLAKLEADDPSMYPNIDNYDDQERFTTALVKHGIYVGKTNAALGKVSKADLLQDKGLTMPDIGVYDELQVFVDANVRYGEALGHKEYYGDKITKPARRK